MHICVVCASAQGGRAPSDFRAKNQRAISPDFYFPISPDFPLISISPSPHFL